MRCTASTFCDAMQRFESVMIMIIELHIVVILVMLVMIVKEYLFLPYVRRNEMAQWDNVKSVSIRRRNKRDEQSSSSSSSKRCSAVRWRQVSGNWGLDYEQT